MSQLYKIARLERKLAWLSALLFQTRKELAHMTAETQAQIDRIKSAYSKNKSAVRSLIEGHKELLRIVRENADNPTELRALADEMEADLPAIAEAQMDNTEDIALRKPTGVSS